MERLSLRGGKETAERIGERREKHAQSRVETHEEKKGWEGKGKEPRGNI